jgi:hypothetical protein
VQRCVQPAICASDQAPALVVGPPFLTRRLEAVRCAFRYVASIMTTFSSPPPQPSPSMILDPNSCRASWLGHIPCAHGPSQPVTRRLCRSARAGHRPAVCHGSLGRTDEAGRSVPRSARKGCSSSPPSVRKHESRQHVTLKQVGPDPRPGQPRYRNQKLKSAYPPITAR